VEEEDDQWGLGDSDIRVHECQASGPTVRPRPGAGEEENVGGPAHQCVIVMTTWGPHVGDPHAPR
jgi:hypothetical protein